MICRSGPVQGFHMQETQKGTNRTPLAGFQSWCSVCSIVGCECISRPSSLVLLQAFFSSYSCRAAGRDEGAGLLSQKGPRTIEIHTV